jgi:hypothetical protein
MPEPWAEWTTTVSISGAPLGDNENPELPVTARCSGADAIGYPIFDRPRRRVEGFVPRENYVDANLGSPNHPRWVCL